MYDNAPESNAISIPRVRVAAVVDVDRVDGPGPEGRVLTTGGA